MAIPLDAAAAAMRETVKRYSIWYLLQGVLMVVAGVLALIYPLLASVAMVYLLAWVLIISGVLQAIGLIGARDVPHYWLERFPNLLNREGFPNQQRSDSRCMLVKGASMHGQSSID